MAKQRLVGGLISEQPREDMTVQDALSTAAVTALRRTGGPLAEVINPPQLGQGSDQPMLRTQPLSAEEVLRFSAKQNKKPFQKYGSSMNPDGTYKNLKSFEARYAADPSAFGPSIYEGIPSTAAMPDYPPIPQRYDPNEGKRKGVPDHLTKAFKKRGIRQKMMDFARQGKAIMGDRRWYHTGPLYQLYVRELGEELANEKFPRDMMTMAATSAGSTLPTNVKNSSYYQYLQAMGLPIEKPVKGSGYGHKVQDEHLRSVQNLIADGGLDYMNNPKRATFTNNLIGNESQVTIDKHNFRMLSMLTKDRDFLRGASTEIGSSKKGAKEPKSVAKLRKKGFKISTTNKDGKTFYRINPQEAFDEGKMTMAFALKNPIFWREAPNDNEYGAYEDFQIGIAEEMGMTPAEFQEATWLGAGGMTGLESPPETAIETIEKRIKYTAEQLGMDPDVVLRQYIRGEIPLAQMQTMQEKFGGIIS